MIDLAHEYPKRILDSFFYRVRATGSKSKKLVSPADCKTLADVPIATADEIGLAIASAANAFEHGTWPRTHPSERAAMMPTFAEALERRMSLFAKLWTAVALASRLTPLAVARLRYFAGLALTYEFEKERNTTLGFAPILPSRLVRQRSYAAFPILMTKLSAALAAGCTCVIKPFR
jgi:aldehyde dehydrogenase (NAD+)